MKTTILYEESDMLVCHKPAGIAVQTASIGQQDVVSELKNYLAGEGDKNPYVGVVHRLDQPVEGVLVFGKNQKATASLSVQIQDGKADKIYRALVYGKFDENIKEGVLENILLKDAKSNSSRVVEAGNSQAKLGKKAKLTYKVLREIVVGEEICSEVEIKLFTGRHHQIRVQMSNIGHPILGDTKYGNEASVQLYSALGSKGLKLCAYCLSLVHPKNGKPQVFALSKLPWE